MLIWINAMRSRVPQGSKNWRIGFMTNGVRGPDFDTLRGVLLASGTLRARASPSNPDLPSINSIGIPRSLSTWFV